MNKLQPKGHLRLAFAIVIALGVSACAPTPIVPVATDSVAITAYPDNVQNSSVVPDDGMMYYDEGGDEYYTETPVPEYYEPPRPAPTPVAPRTVPRPAPVVTATPKPPKKPPVVNTIIAESTTRPLQDAGSVQVETLDVKRPNSSSGYGFKATPTPKSTVSTSVTTKSTTTLSTERTTRIGGGASVPKPTVSPRSYPLSPAAGSLLESAKNEASRNNLGRAGELMERALRMEPNNPTLWMQLAQFRRQQGDTSQAVAMAKKAAQVQPDDTGLEQQSWRFIADVYRASGNQAGVVEAMSHL